MQLSCILHTKFFIFNTTTKCIVGIDEKHTIFAMLFKFQAFVSGAVRFTAGMIHNGWGITYDSLINDTPYWGFLVTYAAYAVLYVAVFTLAKYLGAQKRIMDRAELRRGEDTREETTFDGNGF